METIKSIILRHLFEGEVLTAAKANSIACTSEGGRVLRRIRTEYPLLERMRPNRIRRGSVKEFYFDTEYIREMSCEATKSGASV